MSRRTDVELLSDIREAIRRALAYVAGMEYEAFITDTKTQDAVIRNIEIIGEATKRLSEQVRRYNPEIPWKQMADARDRLIHDYFGVNIDIVWQIVNIELPSVLSMLEHAVSDESGD